MSRLSDSNTIGKQDFEETSTTSLIDIQRVINEALGALGVANQAATDATANTYSSTNVVSNGTDRKVAIGALDERFNGTTGHTHDGTNGEGAQISATNLADFNNLFAEFGEYTFDAASGTSIDVSSLFSGQTPGGDASTEGVITSSPNNFVPIVEKTTGGEIEDSDGDRVFGRLTESAGTWTLSFFTNEAGTETAHSLSSQDIRFLYREVFSSANRPTIGANVAVYDTQSAVGDIPDATATQRGVVSTSAQTFAGVKEFSSRPTTGSDPIVSEAATETLTNKELDGGTASNSNRWVLPSNTTTNLNGLTDVEGSIAYDTDLDAPVYNDGTDWIEIGSGTGGGGGLDVYYTESFEENDHTTLTSGNNATFDNGGTLQGTLATETTSPISDLQSISYTQAVGSLNDWFHTGQISLDEKQTGQISKRVFYANYDGADDDIQAIVWDDTNNNILNFTNIKSSTNSLRYEVAFTIPDGVTALKFGFQVLVENSGAALIYDDEEGTLNPFTAISTFTDQLVRYDTGNGRGSTDTRIRQFANLTEEVGSGIITVANTAANGLTITCDIDCEVSVSYSEYDTGGAAFGLTLNSSQLTTDFDVTTVSDRLTGSRGDGTSPTKQVAITRSFSAGDVIRPHVAGTSQSADDEVSISIYAKAENQAIALPTGANNSIVRVQGANGTGSTNTFIRRFSTIITNEGEAITYTDSAADGASFTINEDGIYHVSFTSKAASGAGVEFGPSLNDIGSINAAASTAILARASSGNENGEQWGTAAITINLSVDDVIRPALSSSSDAGDVADQFTIIKIANKSLSAVPNLDILAPSLVLKDVKVSAGGGTFTAGAWQTRDLNTIQGNQTFLVSLSSNQFTLLPGKYKIRAAATAQDVDRHRTRLRDVTNSTTILRGTTQVASSANDVENRSFILGEFQITEQTAFEIQHYCETTKTTTGFGSNFEPDPVGEGNIFTDVEIQKIS